MTTFNTDAQIQTTKDDAVNLRRYNGQEVEVIRELGDSERDLEDVGRMFEIRFADGQTADAFAYELHERGR